MKPTLKMTKAQLLNSLESSEQRINELESDLLLMAFVKLMNDMLTAIKNELKGDLHLEQIVRSIVPVLVFIYCAGIESKNLIQKISKHFIYEYTTNGLSLQEVYPRSN